MTSWISTLVPLLSSFVTSGFNPLSSGPRHTLEKGLLRAAAFVFFLSGYVLGSVALYLYLYQEVGEVLSLLLLGSTCVLTGGVFLGTVQILKKKSASSPLSAFVERALPSKSLEKISEKIPGGKAALPLLSVLAVGAIVFATEYLRKDFKS